MRHRKPGFVAYLALACALHTSVLVVALRPRPASSTGAAGEQEIDFTVIETPAESAQLPAPENAGLTTSAPSVSPSSSKAKEVPRPHATAAAEAIESSPSMPSSVMVKEGATWTFHSDAIDLGIGKPAQLSPADLRSAGQAGESESPRAAPRPTSTTGGVIESLDAHDVAHGFGRGGPARTAAELATRDAAVMGSAVFGVTIDSALHVTVDLASVSSDYPGWARVAEDIKRMVVAKNVRIPSGAKGLRVAIRVEAKDQFPDGRTPSSIGGKVDVSKTVPGVIVGYSGKVCSGGLHVGLDGVGILGGCSPENAGVPAVRIVSARIVDESRL